MPAIDQVLRINQSTFAWSSTRFAIDGVGIQGLVGVDYEERYDVEEAYAAAPQGTPVAYAGAGEYKVPSFKLKFLKDTWGLVQAMLAAGGSIRPGLGSYGDAIWTCQLQAVEPILGVVPITLVAAPCKVIGKRETRERGISALVTEVDVKCLNLIENGIPLWSLQRSLL